DDRRAADIFARAGDLASAGRLYQKAGAFREASLCHRERGDMTAAANALEAWNPVAAAEAWAEAGRPEDALRILEAIPASSPDRPRAAALLGDLHLAAGHESEALAAYSRAIDDQAKVSHVDVLRVEHAIEALARMGRLEQAIEKLARVKANVAA